MTLFDSYAGRTCIWVDLTLIQLFFIMQDYKVTSEIFGENDYISTSKPTLNKNNVVSKFEFTYPQYQVTIDDDGDLIVPRKNSKEIKSGIIEIEHMKSTALDLVGLQIWRGSLLLADWLIYNHKNILSDNSYILEIASGVGLTSIVASMFAPVICTDIDKGDLLKLIKSNVKRNRHIVKHPVKVLELDFMNDTLPNEITLSLPEISLIIAADTIYDDAITDAFIKTVLLLLSAPPKRYIYVALEKRYVFTIADCDCVAPCYEYFLRSLRKHKNIVMEEVDLDFPKYFVYDRVKELVLWKLSYDFSI